MKFSAEDIANQQFSSRFRGLDPDQVCEFLNGLAREWDHIAQELRRLQSEVDSQAKDLREYRRRERSLIEALEMAKQVADEIRHQADRDAELVIAQTELKADKILAKAERRVANLHGELLDLKQQRIRFRTQMSHLLDGHHQLLEAMSDPEEMESYVVPPAPPLTVPDRGDVDEGIEVADEDVESSGSTDEIRRRPTTLPGFQNEANP